MLLADTNRERMWSPDNELARFASLACRIKSISSASNATFTMMIYDDERREKHGQD